MTDQRFFQRSQQPANWRYLIDPLGGLSKAQYPGDVDIAGSVTVNGLPLLPIATLYGMSPLASAQANTAALQLTIDSQPVGGFVVVPSGNYQMNVTGGLAGAVQVNKRITLIILGRLEANGFAIQANPYYMFNVTADDVVFTGNGSIAGNGTQNQVNNPIYTLANMPGLIYVSGKRFNFSKELTIDKPPKIGIALVNTFDAIISGRWTGGVPVRSDSAYFGIVTSGGGRHNFIAPQASVDSNGGKYVNFIFSGGLFGNSNDCLLSEGYCDAHEKIFYGYGNNHTVTNCQGTGDKTDWIRLDGVGSKVLGGSVRGSSGGITALDSRDITISEFEAIDCKQVGIYITRNDVGYVGGFNDIALTNNVLRGTGNASLFGIYVGVQGADSKDIYISANKVKNFGATVNGALVCVEALTPNSITRLTIENNDVCDTTGDAYKIGRCVGAVIQNNVANNIAGSMLKETASAYSRWLNNSGDGIGSIGITGLDATSKGQGNQYSKNGIEIDVILPEALTLTVSDLKVAPNATITPTPLNKAYGVMTAQKGEPLCRPDGAGGILVSCANDTNFTAGAQCRLTVSQ